jgi:hypothetical protein
LFLYTIAEGREKPMGDEKRFASRNIGQVEGDLKASRTIGQAVGEFNE